MWKVLGIAGNALAAPAMAVTPASSRDKRGRLQVQSSSTSSLAILGPHADYTVDTIKAISGGSIDIEFFVPGSLVPPSQVFDAIASCPLDAAWATPGYWTGKYIAFVVFSTVPFGPATGEYPASMKFGGGEKLMQELYAKYGIHSLVCHMIAPEASGWFRKEIKTLDDLKGLKMRFFDLGANVMPKKAAQFVTWNKRFLGAYRKACEEVAAEQAARSPEFKKAWDSLVKFRATYEPWRQRGYFRD
jgi:TRAP-type mannitol/chloroaromatic compound transport system substrate-binding protein